MNRTQRSVSPSPPSSSSSAFRLDSASFSTASHDTAHALFAPLHYEAKYAYPLIVWLHGQGSDERQLTRIMPLVSMRNYVAVAPRGIGPAVANAGSTSRSAWGDSADEIQEAEQRIFDSIEIARQKLNLARRRVFLAGFDRGGTTAFRVGMSHPHRFAGILSLCGRFPGGGNLLGKLAEIRRLPLFLAIGRDSREWPPEEACRSLRLFHTAGLSISLRQYPCGHELTPQMLADVDRWIIEQITSSDRCAPEPQPHWSPKTD